jgi:Pyridoxal-dependent decarboxylase, C-terminal sheet domain
MTIVYKYQNLLVEREWANEIERFFKECRIQSSFSVLMSSLKSINILLMDIWRRIFIFLCLQMDHNENESKFMYYVNDGVYGSFSCLLNDPAARVNNVRVPSLYALTKLNRASIWGPTCDSIDCIMKNCWLPEMETGQWLVFLDMGAYTFTACCSFNGFCSPYMVYKTTDMHLVSACDDD